MGKHAIILHSLYYGKSAGAGYWMHARGTLEEMGFSSCKDDPDVWFQPDSKVNGVEHHQCVLICADEILAIMEEPEIFLREELVK